MSRLLILFFVCSLAACQASPSSIMSKKDIEANLEFASIVVTAIQKYQADHAGSLPNNLDEASPYVPALPKNIWGEDFRYEIGGPAGYRIGFGDLWCSYWSENHWDCEKSIPTQN